MKFSKIIFIPCAILLLSSVSVFAQGSLLDKGESGSALIFGYTETDDATVTQGSLVVTTKGLVDFGISLGSINPDLIDKNFRIVGLHLELFPIRESAKPGGMPINVSLFGIWTNNEPNNNIAYGLGGSIFKKLKLDEQFYFVPTLGFTKVWPFGFDFDVVNLTSYDFPLVMKFKNKMRLSFTMSFFTSDEQSGTGFFVGLSFMNKTKMKR